MEQKNPIQLMMEGYATLEKKELEKGKQTEAVKEGDVTTMFGKKLDRKPTPLELMTMGYNPDSTQKKETSVDPNDIKEG